MKMSATSEYIPVSNDDGYFIDDRDSVYCKHGNYVGYPGGIDYICHACEEGLNKRKKGVRYNVYSQINDIENSKIKIFQEYSYKALKNRMKTLNQLIAEISPNPQIKITYEKEMYWYWSK